MMLARKTLWAAICDIAESLKSEVRFYLFHRIIDSDLLSKSSHIPDIQNWKLVEVLSLMTILKRSDRIVTKIVKNLCGKTGPIHFIENGLDRYLWAQPTLTGLQSELGGRPDILITSDH